MESSKLPSWIKHADFIALDIISLAVAFFLSYWMKFGSFDFVADSSWRGLFVMVLLTDLVLTLLTGPYSGVFRRGYWEDIGKSLKLALWNFIVVSVMFYLLKVGEDFSRVMLVSTYVVYVLLSITVKALHKKLLLSRDAESKPADSARRAVLVTKYSSAERDMQLVEGGDMRAVKVVGLCLVDECDDFGSLEDDSSVIADNTYCNRPMATVGELKSLCVRLDADEVLVAVDPALVGGETFESIIDDGFRVSFAIAESLGVSSESQHLGTAGVLKTLNLERYSFGSDQILYLPLKRVLDIALGFIGCLLTVPISAAVKLGYLATGDNHPIFYRQERIGFRGQPFQLYKIRSMVWNADEMLEGLLEDPKLREEWARDRKFSNDLRVTRVGRFLRRTSLDEIPQFINVLKGEMSIVGPRPLVPGELEEHGGRPLYNKVKPGITGWWGCNGRSNIDYRERLELEYYYVRHCSPYLDVLCIFRTIVAVIKRDGAQ